MSVDLGADEGRPGRKNNTFEFELKQTCKVRMEALQAYLNKKMAWDNTVLECISKSQETWCFCWLSSLTASRLP
jgi:hypothetical protein